MYEPNYLSSSKKESCLQKWINNLVISQREVIHVFSIYRASYSFLKRQGPVFDLGLYSPNGETPWDGQLLDNYSKFNRSSDWESDMDVWDLCEVRQNASHVK